MFFLRELSFASAVGIDDNVVATIVGTAIDVVVVPLMIIDDVNDSIFVVGVVELTIVVDAVDKADDDNVDDNDKFAGVDVVVNVIAPAFKGVKSKNNEHPNNKSSCFTFNKFDCNRLRRSATRYAIEAAPIAIANVGTKRHNARVASRTIARIAIATDCVKRGTY